MGGDDRLRGAVLGLGSALLFGLGAPVSKLLLPRTQPFMLAAFLYLGAGAAFVVAGPRRSEAPLTRADAPVLATAVIAGAALGPVLMLWGLARVSGLAGSLLLNLEAPFTIALAVLAFGEHLSRREALAAAVIMAGAALLGARGEWTGSGVAAAAIPLLGDRPASLDVAAAALMALGVAALLRLKHEHLHTHQPLEHDHLHVHDSHHQHAHDGPLAEPHSHPHRHDALTHAHAHVSDAHHRHPHR